MEMFELWIEIAEDELVEMLWDEARKEERNLAVSRMIENGFVKEAILDLDYTEEEYETAMAQNKKW